MERRALELYIEHISKITSVVDYALHAVKAFREGNWERLNEDWKRVFDAEREADDLKRKILVELAESTFHPIDREEVVRLVITSDDIASYAKAWCRRLSLLQDGEIPEGIIDKLIEMVSHVLEATKLIQEATRELLARNKKRVLEIADKIETIEEKVDELHVEVLEATLEYCDKSKPSRCIVLREIVSMVENAADKCEDAADVLRSIALLR